MQACAEVGKVSSVLLLPPDLTRLHSKAGFFTSLAYRELSKAGISVTVMPALGTHARLGSGEIRKMFPGIPESLFRYHDWRRDIVELGRIENEWVKEATGGALNCDWPVQVNKLLCSGGFDLIVSIGQVVPHEVVGMANHAKNILVGTGGKEAIDKSHFAGAVFGMEKIMGRADTPVRAMFDEGLRRFSGRLPPILYALTVLSAGNKTPLVLRGLYCGFGRECFELAASLSAKVNIDFLDSPIKKAVVYLDPGEFGSTWLGNKAVYRTRMAMADGGEILILAPGLKTFGEDPRIDALIRRHGYCGTKAVMEKIESDPQLAGSLSAAAHLIHGSGEGRFTVRYCTDAGCGDCTGGSLSRQEIEAAGFEWGSLSLAMEHYGVNSLLQKAATGWNTAKDGESFFFVPNPALGLWALKDSFEV